MRKIPLIQPALVAEAAVTPGHALTVRYNSEESYQACHQHGIALIPVVVGSLGGFEKVAVKEVKKLASALARRTGEEEGSHSS